MPNGYTPFQNAQDIKRLERRLDNNDEVLRRHGHDIAGLATAMELTQERLSYMARPAPSVTTRQWLFLIAGMIGGGIVFIVALWLALGGRVPGA